MAVKHGDNIQQEMGPVVMLNAVYDAFIRRRDAAGPYPSVLLSCTHGSSLRVIGEAGSRPAF